MGLDHGPRVTLAFTLNCAAFSMAMSAVMTSHWCAGTRKVVKPFCTGKVKIKQTYCIHFNSSDVNHTQQVQYIYETGEEKYLMRKFHTGIWFSCEQAVDLVGFNCRDFFEIVPDHERGVLWLCVVGECLYISLLFTGGTLMVMEMSHCCNTMNRLKLNAFAALLTALAGTVRPDRYLLEYLFERRDTVPCSAITNPMIDVPDKTGLFGMLAHMMFTTAFQLAVILGPEDWKPKTWDYSWSYLLAWASFATCMASAVTALNHYTKTMIQFKFKRHNIEKNLELVEMDMPVNYWDMYLNSDPQPPDQHVHLAVNGNRFCSAGLDTEGLDSPCEEYC